MIYLFGKEKLVSVIYDESTLTDADKKGGIAVDALPPKEDKEGFNAVLCLNSKNKPYWEYQEIIEEPVEEETPQE
jgi:hypothetical protein